MNPVVELFQRNRVRRPSSVALIAVTLAVGLGLLSQYTVSAIGKIVIEGEEGPTLTATVPEFFASLPDRIEALLPDSVRRTARGPLDALDRSAERIDEWLVPYVGDFTVGTYAFVRGTESRVVNAILVLILTMYMLIDFERITASLRRAVPRPYSLSVRSLAGTLDQVTGGYVRGQLLIAGLVGAMVFVGLSVIGLPMAGLIGLLAGLLNIVPFIGSIVLVIPALLVAIGGGWVQVVLVLVVFVIANQIDTHVLTPMVLSRSTQLHPVTVMLAVVAGFALGGIWIAVLAVPAVAFLKALYGVYYTKSGFYRRG